MSVRCNGSNAVVVTNIDELPAQGMAEPIMRRLRDQYNLVKLAGSGVSTTHGTSSRSSRPAVLSFFDGDTQHVIFQRGLRHLSVTDRTVVVVPVKGERKTIRLESPITTEGHAALSQLGLA